MKPFIHLPLFLGSVLVISMAAADDEKKPNAVDGVRGVKQEAVSSVKEVDPPETVTEVAPSTIDPATPTTPDGVNKVEEMNQVNGVSTNDQDPASPPPPTSAGNSVDGVTEVGTGNTINGVKAPGQDSPAPQLPTPPVNSMEGVNQVEGIEAVPPTAVQPNGIQPVAPPTGGMVNTIQAVEGVQGILAPKQQNLEAALAVQQSTDGPGPPQGKGAAAAAALLSAPPGLLPGPAPGGDGRDDFQQFEDLKTPGS